MRLAAVVVASLACTLLRAGAQDAPPAPPLAPSHPLLGIWTLRLPDSPCAEVYRFRGDGSSFVTSAQERSESNFRVSAEADAQGWYVLDDVLVKNNGKPDCSGTVTPPGSTVRNYLKFNPAETMFFLCVARALDACVGPFVRAQGATVQRDGQRAPFLLASIR